MIYGDWLYIGLEVVAALLLFWLADYAARILNTKWKLCYLIPAILTMVFLAVLQWEVSLSGVYVGSLILSVGFFKEEKKVRKACSTVAMFLMIGSVMVACNYSGYRAPDYVEDFQKGFDCMKEHYVLSDYKEIDWDALYEEYLPRFQDADRRHDAVDNSIVWQDFTHEFHDGHVAFMTSSEEIEKQALTKMSGNDYGLSLMTLENGKTVAVNVDENIKDYMESASDDMIHNGTEILSWDDMTMDEAKNQVAHRIMAFQDKDNEAFYSALLVAGLGKDSVHVTYLNDKGQEVETNLIAKDSYYDRLQETIAIIDQGIEGENLSWSEPEQGIACLRINQMMYDSKSYEDGDHSQMEEEIRQQLETYQEKGINRLIIDLRNNQGGSPHFIMTLGKLLSSKGEYINSAEAVWDDEKKEFKKDPVTGNYIMGDALTYQGEGLWDDGEILLLINAECVSAGDHFIMMMSKQENVTVMGFTKSMSSGQAVNSIKLDSGTLCYSGIPALDENGNIFIDTDASRISMIPLNEKVPFNQDAVKSLFDDKEDYLLNQAISYLK